MYWSRLCIVLFVTISSSLWACYLFQLFSSMFNLFQETRGNQEPLLPLCLPSLKTNFMLTESEYQHDTMQALRWWKGICKPTIFFLLTLSIISPPGQPDLLYQVSHQCAGKKSFSLEIVCSLRLSFTHSHGTHTQICSKDIEFSSQLVQKFR